MSDKMREAFEVPSINRKAIQHEIEKNVAEMRHKSYVCESRFAIAGVPGIQVHVVVTREEENFLDEIDPAFTAQEPQQAESEPAWWEVSDWDSKKFCCKDREQALRLAEYYQNGDVVPLFYANPQPSAQVLKLLEVAKAMRNWIDAIPANTPLPVMPGFDRDWADSVIDATPSIAEKDYD